MKTVQRLMTAVGVVVLLMGSPKAAEAGCRNMRSKEMGKMREMEKSEGMSQCCRRMNHAGHAGSQAETDAPSSQVPREPKAAATEAAEGAPSRLEDPVCSMPVDPKTAAKSVYNGKAYYFCSKEHKAEFDKDPAKYVKATGSR